MSILASAPGPEEIRDAARQVLEEEKYQTEIPTTEVEGREMPEWLRKLLAWLARSFGGSAIEIFLWVVLALILILFVRWLITEWQHRRRPPPEPVSEVAALSALVLEGFPDPHALAREGDFPGAVHALLLAAQEILRKSLKFDLKAAFTSREILNRAKLEESAQKDLRTLVLAVEVSHFGGADVDHTDWERCRERYDRFVSALGGERR